MTDVLSVAALEFSDPVAELILVITDDAFLQGPAIGHREFVSIATSACRFCRSREIVATASVRPSRL